MAPAPAPPPRSHGTPGPPPPNFSALAAPPASACAPTPTPGCEAREPLGRPRPRGSPRSLPASRGPRSAPESPPPRGLLGGGARAGAGLLPGTAVPRPRAPPPEPNRSERRGHGRGGGRAAAGLAGKWLHRPGRRRGVRRRVLRGPWPHYRQPPSRARVGLKAGMGCSAHFPRPTGLTFTRRLQMGEGGRGKAFPKLATSGLTGSELGPGCWEDGILLSLPLPWVSDSGRSRYSQ